MEYSILSLLPEHVGQYHRALRLKIEQQFQLGGPTEFPVPSHITLKYRFPVENMPELEGVLKDFCAAQAKTPWSLHGFDYFANGDNYVIFINVIPSLESRAAHAHLLDCLRSLPWMQWGPFDHANLHYHVTLASKGLTADNFQLVWAFVNQQSCPKYDLWMDNLTLLQISEDGAKICSYLPFGLGQLI